jgi:hypothetical protein
MPNNDDLVPVFMPSLASVLARAEALKGSRLTEDEILRIRDAAPCIMMAPADARKLVESRGYHDVNPENYWADWHRLRVQMTGDGYLPKIVLCVVGDEYLENRCRPILDADKTEYECSNRDKRMVRAFQASARRFDPSLTPEDLASITGHAKVLYVLSKNFTAEQAPAVSRSFLRLGGKLLGAGAVGLKCESSGIAHGRSRWLELASEADTADFWPARFRAYVQMPIQNDADYYSCGLHLLGQPDLIISETLLRQAYDTADHVGEAIDLFAIFALYLVGECQPGQFASGHTFSVKAGSPRFRVVWEECTGYDEDEFFFNPFGRWRFAELL